LGLSGRQLNYQGSRPPPEAPLLSGALGGHYTKQGSVCRRLFNMIYDIDIQQHLVLF